jgi:hypothetical protein
MTNQPHPGQKSSLTPRIEEATRQELRKADRTRSCQQVCKRAQAATFWASFFPR